MVKREESLAEKAKKLLKPGTCVVVDGKDLKKLQEELKKLRQGK